MDEIEEKHNASKDPNSSDKLSKGSKNKDDEAKTNISIEVPENEQKPVKANVIPFTFFTQNEDALTMSMQGIEIENIYGKNKGNYKYVICILLNDDSGSSSQSLEITLEGIKNNLENLADISIKCQEILICVFVNYISTNQLINEEALKLLKTDTDFLNVPKIYNSVKDFNINIIYKNNYLSEVAALKFFYLGIINQLKQENKILFTTIISAGVVPAEGSLIKLIQLSYNSNDEKYHLIVVPALERYEDNLISKIKKYERVHFNLYNMNFYDSVSSVPVNSQLNTMTITDNLLKKLKSYYPTIHENATINYHDYNLSLFLFQNGFTVRYFQKEILAEIAQGGLTLAYCKDLWVNRYSGYYGNFFEILRTFISSGTVLNKIFTIFQLIGIAIEFIYPSLSLMVIYAGLQEGFNADYRISTFFTLLYLVILLASGACSLTTKYAQKLEFVNYFFTFFMEIFYLFFLCTSIAGMDNINKGKNDLYYKFNKGACAALIILTFLVGIMPILIKITSVSKNILPMLLYLVLGAPTTSSIFQLAKILNASDTIGGENMEDRKGVYILIFFLFNLFFGSLTFYNYNTKKRANAVMGLAIFYLIYLFFKIIAIISNILNSSKNPDVHKEVNSSIKSEFEGINNSQGQFYKKNELANSSSKLQDENYYEESPAKLHTENYFNYKNANNENNNNENNNNENNDNDNNENNDNHSDNNENNDNHNESNDNNNENNNSNHDGVEDNAPEVAQNENENNENGENFDVQQNEENKENDEEEAKNNSGENNNGYDSNND